MRVPSFITAVQTSLFQMVFATECLSLRRLALSLRLGIAFQKPLGSGRAALDVSNDAPSGSKDDFARPPGPTYRSLYSRKERVLLSWVFCGSAENKPTETDVRLGGSGMKILSMAFVPPCFTATGVTRRRAEPAACNVYSLKADGPTMAYHRWVRKESLVNYVRKSIDALAGCTGHERSVVPDTFTGQEVTRR
jgi:hypothetical protein